MSTVFRLFPESASTMSPQVDRLFVFLVLVGGGVTLLIFILILYFGLRYRRRPGENSPPPRTRTLTWLEITWTIVPFLISMIMFVWGADLYVQIFHPPPEGTTIYVIAKQWMWKIQHPDGHREINEVHIPVGRPVRLVMSSQDVIHDFFVPAFRVKHDVLPGRYTSIWFTATHPGDFRFFCSQYCGAGHAGMGGRVVAMEPARYEAWLSGTTPEDTPAQAGSRLFVQFGCASCHGTTAPTLAGLYRSKVELQDGSTVIADENYIRNSILDSTSQIVKGYPPIMPSYRAQVTEVQMMQLVEYIKSLSDPMAEEGRVKKP